MKYVILNDGETYSALLGSIIYDSEADKCYRINVGNPIVAFSAPNRWLKGIREINENEDGDTREESNKQTSKENTSTNQRFITLYYTVLSPGHLVYDTVKNIIMCQCADSKAAADICYSLNYFNSTGGYV